MFAPYGRREKAANPIQKQDGFPKGLCPFGRVQRQSLWRVRAAPGGVQRQRLWQDSKGQRPLAGGSPPSARGVLGQQPFKVGFGDGPGVAVALRDVRADLAHQLHIFICLYALADDLRA